MISLLLYLDVIWSMNICYMVYVAELVLMTDIICVLSYNNILVHTSGFPNCITVVREMEDHHGVLLHII